MLPTYYPARQEIPVQSPVQKWTKPKTDENTFLCADVGLLIKEAFLCGSNKGQVNHIGDAGSISTVSYNSF
jgi:hypothetical protein